MSRTTRAPNSPEVVCRPLSAPPPSTAPTGMIGDPFPGPASSYSATNAASGVFPLPLGSSNRARLYRRRPDGVSSYSR